MKVYNAITVPTLTYVSETWVLNTQQESAVQATVMKLLRRIEEKRGVDRVRNVKIREEVKQEGVLEKVQRSQLRWSDAFTGQL